MGGARREIMCIGLNVEWDGGGGVSIMMLELYVGEIRGFWKCIG